MQNKSNFYQKLVFFRVKLEKIKENLDFYFSEINIKLICNYITIYKEP